MWTPKTRSQHDREHLRYGSDLTDKEWQLIEPFLPPPEVAMTVHDQDRPPAGPGPQPGPGPVVRRRSVIRPHMALAGSLGWMSRGACREADGIDGI